MSNSSSTQHLADRMAIENLRSQYSWYLDHWEWDEWASLLTEDIEMFYDGPINELANAMDPLKGRKDVLSFATDTFPKMFSGYNTLHLALMPNITINGDQATGKWYLLVYSRPEDEGRERWVAGTYTDTYKRVDNEWKFARIETKEWKWGE